MNVFDPSKSMNALANGMNVGSHIRDKQTMNALAPMVANNDFKGAMDYAGSRGDLGQVQAMQTQYQSQLTAEQEQRRSGILKYGMSLLQMSPEQRNPQEVAMNLRQFGVEADPSQFTDLSDDAIKRVLTSVQDTESLQKQYEEMQKPVEYTAQSLANGQVGAFNKRTGIVGEGQGPEAAEGPMSPEGKLAADLAAGRISQEQYQMGVARMTKPGTTVNVGGPQTPSQYEGLPDGTRVDAPPGTKDLPAGQVYEVRNGQLTIQNLSGSEADRTAKDDERKRLGKQADTEQAGRTVVREVGRGLQLMPNVVGWGKSPTPGEEEYAGGAGEIATANARVALSQIPGTSEFLFKKHIDSALSNVGLDKLQSMRDNSPTGGALGQVPIQQQKRLEQVLGSFDIALPRTVTEENLKYLNNAYMDIMYGSEQERQFAIQEGKLPSEENDRIQQNYYDLNWNEFGRFEPPPEGFQIVE